MPDNSDHSDIVTCASSRYETAGSNAGSRKIAGYRRQAERAIHATLKTSEALSGVTSEHHQIFKAVFTNEAMPSAMQAKVSGIDPSPIIQEKLAQTHQRYQQDAAAFVALAEEILASKNKGIGRG